MRRQRKDGPVWLVRRLPGSVRCWPPMAHLRMETAQDARPASGVQRSLCSESGPLKPPGRSSGAGVFRTSAVPRSSSRSFELTM